MPNTAIKHHDNKTKPHTAIVQVTLTIEVDVEASSKEEAVRKASVLRLPDQYVIIDLTQSLAEEDRRWVVFDQTTKVVEVTS